jgi:siroheme synthase-like protein
VTILPIGVRAESLTVLVVGGGGTGARKALAFLEAGARVRVVDPAPAEELPDGHARLEIVARAFTESDVAAADLVVAATDNPDVNAQVAAACRARRLLCNRVDDPAAGTFDTLAVHRSGPLVIGVSAGGVPGAAARIRDEIAHRFDERYADAVARLAQLRAQLRPSGDWTRVSEQLTARDFCESVENGALSQRLTRWD